MNTLKNFLSSGFYFAPNEIELKLRYRLFNFLLAFNALAVFSAGWVRLYAGNIVQFIVDISYALFALLALYLIRQSKEYFGITVKVVLLASLSVVTISYFLHFHEHVGISWFLVQVLATFVLTDRRFAYFMFVLCTSIIIALQITFVDSYSLFNTAFVFAPYIVFMLFVEFYEQRNQEQKKLLKLQNERLKNYDNLTQLPNRTLFIQNLEDHLISSENNVENFSIIKLDLDDFTNVNNTYGPQFGDKFLAKVSDTLRYELNDVQYLSRVGADEYLFCTPATTSDELIAISEKLLHCFDKGIIVEDKKLYITVSIGIAIYPKDGIDANVLMKNVDSALYQAKQSGKNCYVFYNTAITDQLDEKVLLLNQLKESLSKEEFHVRYQPKIDAVENKVIGMEALVRWENNIVGDVSPAKFIPLAEANNLIYDIDTFVMQTAMSDYMKWKKSYPEIGRLSLNLSVKLLHEENYIDFIKDTLQKLDFKPDWLELEITENFLMQNIHEAIKILEKFHELGIYISIDDFGTGYSSLAYLQKLPINILKIDRSFINEIPNNQESNNIVKAIMRLSESLGLDAIAEGVEKEEQKDFLLQNKCRKIQGYLYSKPLKAKDFEQFLARY